MFLICTIPNLILGCSTDNECPDDKLCRNICIDRLKYPRCEKDEDCQTTKQEEMCVKNEGLNHGNCEIKKQGRFHLEHSKSNF